MMLKNPSDFADYVEQNYPRWSQAVGRVTKIYPFAIFMEFEDGIQGIVRRREFSWEGQAQASQLSSPGQLLEVVVINTDHAGQRLELSRRLVEKDPWQDFVNTGQVGQTVRGQVIRLMPYGAFVEIRPGVVGLVHVAEIAPWFVEQIEDVLWVGDEVAAEILSIDSAKRHIGLSIKKYLNLLEQKASQAMVAAYLNRPSGLTLSLGDRLGLSASQLERRVGVADESSGQTKRHWGKILVVDDEQSLTDQMGEWIYRLGYKVDTVYTAEAGIERTLTTPYALIFMDLNMPGLDGLAAARQILAQRPATPIVLMTGADLMDEHHLAIEAMKFADVLLKPFTPQDIEGLLNRIERNDQIKGSYTLPHNQALAQEIGFFQRLTHSTGGALAESLSLVLAELQTETQAQAVAIFALDPIHHKVLLTAQTGLPLAFEQAKPHLSESPIKDVALEQQIIWEKNAKGRGAARFRYLLPLLEIGSCIGVPIRTQGAMLHHSLFLFHAQANYFSAYHLQRTLVTALVLQTTIEHHHIEQTMQASQRLFLAGQLSGGLAHEVNNKLASVEFHTADLLRAFERLAQEYPQLTNNLLYRDLQRATEAIALMNRSVLETARIFRTLMSSEELRWLNLNELIQQTLRLTQPLARKHQVELTSSLEPDLPRTLAVAVRLQQALHNVILN
ncbi:MAG: S1 RNA-binding domain-containing protein, partial [Anaerolineae bacterium]